MLVPLSNKYTVLPIEPILLSAPEVSTLSAWLSSPQTAPSFHSPPSFSQPQPEPRASAQSQNAAFATGWQKEIWSRTRKQNHGIYDFINTETYIFKNTVLITKQKMNLFLTFSEETFDSCLNFCRVPMSRPNMRRFLTKTTQTTPSHT